MRRALLFISFLTMVLAMWAGDVSPEQALKQAQNFVQNQVTAGRRAPGATPQLALKGMVSGLYVFNVADDEGFVIVSNDDRTFPVLGYSTSGSIDPNNMPANMRAWLQGYADEIAWMNEHNIQPASQSSSRRTNRSVKTPIAPLVETQWDQGAPYNNLTPYYGLDSNYNYIYSTEGGNGWSHCATGCVATAMAQVMKYHQWPTSPTKNISSYSWYDYTLGPLTSTITFDWTNMQNTYSGNETGTTATAIATLMQYCGYSVEMDYGPESGSDTQNVAAALKKYFDYKGTTQFVSRSYYSYDNWVDLIYFELEHNRPVVYGGASTGGGHEFVCDGYQYMEETDYFHINWGWGGTSDQYFVLSVLNPFEQGTGGSSTNDGFPYGQDAVIGIQPSTGTGTMSGITPNTVNLTLVSITPSSSTIALGNSVDVTIRVHNNSDDVYDGEVWLAVNNALAIGDMFLIAKNETKDCNFTFTPDDNGTYTLRAAFPRGDGYYSLSSESATVTATEDPTPTNVAVSNVTPTSATVTWDGISESYNMRYRTASVEAGEWVVISEAINESTYSLTGLTSETKYEVQVRAVLTEGTSAWSSSATFTTPSPCAVPYGLTVADVSYDAATLSWTGYQDSYNVRYRAAGGRIGYVFVDFENGNTGTWSQNDGGVANFTNDTNHFLMLGHNSTDTQYLITSKLTGIKNGSTVEFYQRRFNSGTTFQVGFSSTTADLGAFTWREQTAADSYTLYSEVIPAGTKYIAIRTTATEPAKALIIDDFGIYSPAYEEGSWVETNNITQKTLAISGLTPGTLYEWQVQGNSETCEGTTDWCSTVLFTTAELIELLNDDKEAATKNTELIAAYDEVSAYVTLSGRTVAGNNQWNTFCLPFDISTSELATYLSMSQENITARVLDKANTSLSSEGELTLSFTDVTETIPAGTPFIMKCDTETASIDLSSHPISATIDGSQTANARKEQTSNDGKVKFVGQWSTFDITDANLNEIVYIGSNNKIGYSKSPRTLKCMRAHFWIQPKATGAPALTSIYVDFGDGETTSIDLTNADSNEQSTGWYTIDGVKLSGEPAQKGLYIYNGKKVIK